MNNKYLKKILYLLCAFICIFSLTYVVGYFVNFGIKNPLSRYSDANMSYIKYYLKFANYWIYIVVSSILTFITYLSIKTVKEKDKDKRIEKLFLLVLALSLFVIFFKFIIGNVFYIYTDIGRDTMDTYYPYYTNELLNIKNFNFSFWMFDFGLGASNLNMSSWTFDPFSLFTIVVSLALGASKLSYLLVFMQIGKIVCLYFLTKKYLSYFVKNKTAICLSSYLCAMNGYIFLWGQHYFFGTACVFLLLALCAIEHILNDNDKYKYVYLSIIICFLLIYSFYTGYMILLTTSIYFLIRYLSIKKKIEIKKCICDIGKYAYGIIVGMLLSCVIFLPSCYNVITTSSRLDNATTSIFVRMWESFKGSFSLDYINLRLSRMLSNNSLFINDNSMYPHTNYYELFQLCITVFIIFFLVQWFIYKIRNNRGIKEHIIFALEVFFLYLLIFNGVSGLILNAFVTEAYRYTFVIMPFLALIISIVWEKVIVKGIISKTGAIVSLFITIYAWVFSYNNSVNEVKDVLIILLILILIGYLIILLSSFFKGKKSFTVLLIAIIVLSTGFENYITTNKRQPWLRKNYYLSWNRNELNNTVGEAISWIKGNDSSYYRIEKNFANVSLMGDSLIEQRPTASWYNSAINPYINSFYDNIYTNASVLPTVKLFKLEDESDKQALYLINSKYILSQIEIKVDDIELLRKIGDVYIYRNNQTDSIAKFYNKTITEKEYLGLEKEEKNKILYDTVIIDDLEIDNDSTAIVSDFYLKNNVLSGSVESDGKGILLISIPYQEGWNVYVDGNKQNLLRVDYGFVGISIDEGKHDITLKYSLPKFNEGLILSSIGLINIAFIIVVNKKKNIN